MSPRRLRFENLVSGARTRFEPPRWRRRRSSDLRAIAIVYGAALLAWAAGLGLTVAAMTEAESLATGLGLALFALVLHLALGGVVVAYLTRRVALWEGWSLQEVLSAKLHAIIAWPIAVGRFLSKATLNNIL